MSQSSEIRIGRAGIDLTIVALAGSLLILPAEAHAYSRPSLVPRIISSTSAAPAPTIVDCVVEVDPDISRFLVRAERVLSHAESACAKLRNPAVRQRAGTFVERLRRQLTSEQLSRLPPLELIETEEGAATLEWFLPDRRLAFTFGSEQEVSGWHFVSSISSGGVRAYGGSFEISIPALVDWALLSS